MFCVPFASVCLNYVLRSILTARRREDTGSIQANPLSSCSSIDSLIYSSSDTVFESSNTSSSKGVSKEKDQKEGEREKFFSL